MRRAHFGSRIAVSPRAARWPAGASLLLATVPMAALGSKIPAAVEVRYVGPENRDGAGADQFDVPLYEAETRLFVWVADTNLRAAASADAALVGTLAHGTAIKIVAAAGDKVKIAGRVDRWYQIETAELPARTGYVFGGALTPAGFDFDLDGNGTPQAVTVAYTPDYRVKVRSSDTTGVRELSLAAGGQAYACCGGLLEVETIPASTSGIPLLRIRSGVEACGDFVVYYVSETSGRLLEALSTSGLADPPNHAVPTVTFNAKKRTALLTMKTWSDEESPPGPGSKQRFVLRNGVFVPTGKHR